MRVSHSTDRSIARSRQQTAHTHRQTDDLPKRGLSTVSAKSSMASGSEFRSTSTDMRSCSREALAVGMAPRSSSAPTSCWCVLVRRHAHTYIHVERRGGDDTTSGQGELLKLM